MNIQSTYCECPRGEYKCSHAAALYIHGIHNLSRTDIECQWKRKRSADCLVSSNAAEMFPSKKCFNPLSRQPNNEDRSFLYKEFSGFGMFTGLYWLMTPEDARSTPTSSAPLIESVIKDVLVAELNERSPLFQKLMALDEEKIKKINHETTGQKDNELWHSTRKGRLTASNFGLVLKSKKFTPSLRKQLLGNYNIHGVKAVQWGIAHEAITQFCKENGTSVIKSGIWLDRTELLGASPDGIVLDEDAIVGIKCPFPIRNESVLNGLDKPSFF